MGAGLSGLQSCPHVPWLGHSIFIHQAASGRAYAVISGSRPEQARRRLWHWGAARYLLPQSSSNRATLCFLVPLGFVSYLTVTWLWQQIGSPCKYRSGLPSGVYTGAWNKPSALPAGQGRGHVVAEMVGKIQEAVEPEEERAPAQRKTQRKHSRSELTVVQCHARYLPRSKTGYTAS